MLEDKMWINIFVYAVVVVVVASIADGGPLLLKMHEDVEIFLKKYHKLDTQARFQFQT